MNISDLVRKLGIKSGMKVLLQDAPAEFRARLEPLPDGARVVTTSSDEADCIVAFVRCKADVKKVTVSTLSAINDEGLLWFAYPKKSGPLQGDLSRDSGWEPLLRSCHLDWRAV